MSCRFGAKRFKFGINRCDFFINISDFFINRCDFATNRCYFSITRCSCATNRCDFATRRTFFPTRSCNIGMLPAVLSNEYINNNAPESNPRSFQRHIFTTRKLIGFPEILSIKLTLSLTIILTLPTVRKLMFVSVE